MVFHEMNSIKFSHSEKIPSFMENRANSGSKDASEEDAAIAAALQNSLFYSQHPSNFLYSQWLASRNTSALFGLQGLSNSISL